MKYDITNDNFTVYEPVETPKVKMDFPLLDDIQNDISSWADGVVYRPSGESVPIVSDNTNIFNINNTEEHKVNQSTLENTKVSIKGDQKKTGDYIINSLMNRLKLTREQAAGITGVMMSESGLNPSAYNKREKAGIYKGSSANGAGYGAGTLQWSNKRKDTALKLIGKVGTPIESLSLDDQIEMLSRELEGPYKNTLLGIKASKSASEAAATMYCHNVGGFSSSTSPATQDEIDKMNKRYKFTGNSSLINRGMQFAEAFLQ